MTLCDFDDPDFRPRLVPFARLVGWALVGAALALTVACLVAAPLRAAEPEAGPAEPADPARRARVALALATPATVAAPCDCDGAGPCPCRPGACDCGDGLPHEQAARPKAVAAGLPLVVWIGLDRPHRVDGAVSCQKSINEAVSPPRVEVYYPDDGRLVELASLNGRPNVETLTAAVALAAKTARDLRVARAVRQAGPPVLMATPSVE